MVRARNFHIIIDKHKPISIRTPRGLIQYFWKLHRTKAHDFYPDVDRHCADNQQWFWPLSDTLGSCSDRYDRDLQPRIKQFCISMQTGRHTPRSGPKPSTLKIAAGPPIGSVTEFSWNCMHVRISSTVVGATVFRFGQLSTGCHSNSGP